MDVNGVLAGVTAGGGAALLVAGAGLVVHAQVAAEGGLSDELVAGKTLDVVGWGLGQIGYQAADVGAESRAT